MKFMENVAALKDVVGIYKYDEILDGLEVVIFPLKILRNSLSGSFQFKALSIKERREYCYRYQHFTSRLIKKH